MAEIDCRKWRGRCDFLENLARNGITDEQLRRMGIEPGSERARKLEDGLYRVFQHCCTQYLGHVEEPEDPEVVEAGIGPAGAAIALGEAAPLFTEAEVVFLTRALRFGLIGLLLYVANFIARRAGYQICPLIRIRIQPFGETDFIYCNYYCGTRWYSLSLAEGGLICPRFIVVPV